MPIFWLGAMSKKNKSTNQLNYEITRDKSDLKNVGYIRFKCLSTNDACKKHFLTNAK